MQSRSTFRLTFDIVETQRYFSVSTNCLHLLNDVVVVAGRLLHKTIFPSLRFPLSHSLPLPHFACVLILDSTKPFHLLSEIFSLLVHLKRIGKKIPPKKLHFNFWIITFSFDHIVCTYDSFCFFFQFISLQAKILQNSQAWLGAAAAAQSTSQLGNMSGECHFQLAINHCYYRREA